MTDNMLNCHLCVKVLGHLPRAPNQRVIEKEIEKMDVAIRELDAAELAAVTGGSVASDLGKIAWGLTGALIGGTVVGAASAGFYVVTDAFFNHISSTCGQCGGDLGQPM